MDFSKSRLFQIFDGIMEKDGSIKQEDVLTNTKETLTTEKLIMLSFLATKSISDKMKHIEENHGIEKDIDDFDFTDHLFSAMSLDLCNAMLHIRHNENRIEELESKIDLLTNVEGGVN